MRWPHESAIARRNAHLARTRRLSIWIAGGATTASVGLAAALGWALPGHTASASQPSTGTTSGTTSGTHGTASSGSGRGSGTPAGHGARHTTHKTGIRPPSHPPRHTSAPPVVSSGGS